MSSQNSQLQNLLCLSFAFTLMTRKNCSTFNVASFFFLNLTRFLLPPFLRADLLERQLHLENLFVPLLSLLFLSTLLSLLNGKLTLFAVEMDVNLIKIREKISPSYKIFPS